MCTESAVSFSFAEVRIEWTKVKKRQRLEGKDMQITMEGYGMPRDMFEAMKVIGATTAPAQQASGDQSGDDVSVSDDN